MPFVNKAQERACYAKNDPNWNCKEYAKKHSKKRRKSSKMANRKRRKSSKKRRKSSKKRRKSSKKRRKSSKKRRKSSKKRRKSSKKRRKSSKKRRKSSKKRRKSSKKRRKSSKKRRKSSKKRRKSSKKRRKSSKKRRKYNDNTALRDFRNTRIKYEKDMLVIAKKELDRYNESITNDKNRWYLPINLDDELTLKMVNKVLLGEGSDGFVVRLCKGNDNNCDYAMKVQGLTSQYEMEVEALRDLQSTNSVPKVYDSWKSNNRGYIIMEYIPACDKISYPRDVKKIGIRYDKASELLKKLEDKGWLQVDMHLQNIRCRDGDMNKLVLIDLGWVVKKGKDKYPDHPLSKRWGYDLDYDELKIVTNNNFNHNFYDHIIMEKYVKNVPDEQAIAKAYNELRKKVENVNKTVNPSSFHDGKIVYSDSN